MPDALPPGATPLDPDEADGLLPDHLSTRGELNAWEQLNIAKAIGGLRNRKRDESVLDMRFVHELHAQMFSDTMAGGFTWE